MMIEAFYDSTAYVPGLSPGADEAVSIATLLELARKFKETPPERSVLLVATSGHAQSLAGLRDLVWSLRASPKDLRKQKKHLRDLVKDTRKVLNALDPKLREDSAENADPEDSPLETLLKRAISDEIKTRVDEISRELMRLRLEQPDPDQKLSGRKIFRSLPKTGFCFGNWAGNPPSRASPLKRRQSWISSCLPPSCTRKPFFGMPPARPSFSTMPSTSDP